MCYQRSHLNLREKKVKSIQQVIITSKVFNKHYHCNTTLETYGSICPSEIVLSAVRKILIDEVTNSAKKNKRNSSKTDIMGTSQFFLLQHFLRSDSHNFKQLF